MKEFSEVKHQFCSFLGKPWASLSLGITMGILKSRFSELQPFESQLPPSEAMKAKSFKWINEFGLLLKYSGSCKSG